MALRQLGVWVEGAGGAATESGQCRAAGRLRGKADRLGAEMPPKPHCLGSCGQVLCHSYACAESGSPGGGARCSAPPHHAMSRPHDSLTAATNLRTPYPTIGDFDKHATTQAIPHTRGRAHSFVVRAALVHSTASVVCAHTFPAG